MARHRTLCIVAASVVCSLASASTAFACAGAAHSRDMVLHGFFAHDSPTGSTPKERMDRAGYFAGASSWALGETIAWGTGSRATPAAIVRSWLRSPGHRAILLDGRYHDLGIGIAVGAPGQSSGATFTGDFGARG
jgi:uncharacterized protein YkwD